MSDETRTEMLRERVLRKSRSTIHGCWFWEGYKNPQGYGKLHTEHGQLAHRLSYVLWRGEIPVGATLDHLCGNRSCVNPWHLEAVAPRTNIMRGRGVAAKRARQTHCKHGHELTLQNTYSPPSKPRKRECRQCRDESSAHRRTA